MLYAMSSSVQSVIFIEITNIASPFVSRAQTVGSHESLTATTIISKERPSKNNPIGKITGSFKEKFSPLLHASQPSRSSSIDMNLSSDNHMPARRYVGKWCCRTLTDLFSSKSPLIVPMVGVDHAPTTAVPTTSTSVPVSALIPTLPEQFDSTGILGSQTSLTVSDHIALTTVSR